MSNLFSNLQSQMKSFLQSMLAVGLGLVLGGILAWLAGENPLHVINVIVIGAFGTPYDQGMVLYFASILIATGLAVAIPFQAGIFNIGAEGQVLVSALACAITAGFMPSIVPGGIGIFLAIGAGVLAASLWGGIAGAIRSFRGGHEVISSIMLNFIAAGVTGWLVVGRFQAVDSQNPETVLIKDQFRLSHFEIFQGAPASIAIIGSIFVALLFSVILNQTRLGLKLKAVRQSPDAASVAGFDVRWIRFWSFFAGSAICGIAGSSMVLAEAGRFRMDMSDGFGFLGIPVALVGKGRPAGIVLAAFLFAALHHGASSLDLESTRVSRDLAQVIEALVVLAVVVLPGVVLMIKNFKTIPVRSKAGDQA